MKVNPVGSGFQLVLKSSVFSRHFAGDSPIRQRTSLGIYQTAPELLRICHDQRRGKLCVFTGFHFMPRGSPAKFLFVETETALTRAEKRKPETAFSIGFH